MTLPYEEENALIRTERFLTWLLGSTKSERTRMPQEDFKRRVSACLHHYPMKYRIEELYEGEKE